MNTKKLEFLLLISGVLYVSDSIAATPLWGTTLESKIDVVDSELEADYTGANAKIDTIDSTVGTISTAVGNLTTCGLIPLSSSDISGGIIIMISSSGSYCLTEDVTATFSITAHNVSLNLNERIVTGYIVVAGDEVVVANGTIKPVKNAANPGIEVASISNRSEIHNILVIASNQSSPGWPGLNCIEINGRNWEIYDCRLIAGYADQSGGSGNDGGSSIVVGAESQNTMIWDCILQGAHGADSSSTVTAGNGGHGINILSGATMVDIYDCIVEVTGNGGPASGSGDGGNGGHGINVESGTAGVSVSNCVVRDTGAGGSSSGGGFDGAGGKAIFDLSSGGTKSIVVGNLAYLIDNSTKFDLLATDTESGIEIDPYPPDGTQINMNKWGNYFVDN